MHKLICGFFNQIVVLKGVMKSSCEHSRWKKVHLFDLQMCFGYTCELFTQWWQVLQSFKCAGNFTPLQWIRWQFNLCGDQPWYLSGDHHKGLRFLDSDGILIPAATNRCTSLWNLPLFTPVMCVNIADRLPAAVNTECVKVALPREKQGGVLGNICRIQIRVMLVRTAFYCQAKACLSARDHTVVHVKGVCWRCFP